MRALSARLLTWYGAHARALPWRIGPKALMSGAQPDPYRVWLSEIMLQQTTVATVAPRYGEFLARWPTVEAIAAAPLDEVLSAWAGLGYYARARNLHQCAVVVAARGGFPDTEEGLRALPGVGAYTAAAIAAIAFGRRAIVMDGNIERVAARLFAIETPLPKAKAELKAAIAGVWPAKRSGDFAQGLMDLGASVCTPRNPKCLLCPLRVDCKARAQGVASHLPVKPQKTIKPTRRGIAYALVNAKGEMLFERRADKGLLGGMLGLPCTDWIKDAPVNALASAGEGRGPRAEISAIAWRCRGAVTHTFTHFRLELEVMTASAPKSFRLAGTEHWRAPESARLPTVMRKAVEKARLNPLNRAKA